jgi:alpha-tubulin suppressor-like RCC1 family protein
MYQSCGPDHCVQIDALGRAFTFALHPKGNRFGQLGRTTNLQDVEVKKQIQDVSIKWVKCAASKGSKMNEAGHTLLLSENSTVFSFGCDRWQQLGLGQQWALRGLTVSSPTQVPMPLGITFVDIACGKHEIN